MSKAVLISIRPQWCELIASGKKTAEVRKTRPKLKTPFKCYIYMTKSHNGVLEEAAEGNFIEKQYAMAGKVIGEFVCDCITGIRANNAIQTYYNGIQGTCLTDAEIIRYASGKMIYYWHISNLVIYDKPKELSEFLKYGYDDALADWEDLHCIGVNGIGCSVKYPPMPNEDDYKLTHPPQSWCYVEEIE